MKKVFLALVSAALCGVLVACAPAGSPAASGAPGANSTDAAEYHALTAEEAKARMDSGDEIIIVDVRTEDEYNEKHIPNAVLVPNETIGTEKPAELPDLDAEILVYCRSGNRSRQAAEKLVAMGYTKVYDFGGINSWPYETE